MSKIRPVSNKTLTLAEVYIITKIFGTSTEIYNLSAIGNTLSFLGDENKLVIFIADMPIVHSQPCLYKKSGNILYLLTGYEGNII